MNISKYLTSIINKSDEIPLLLNNVVTITNSDNGVIFVYRQDKDVYECICDTFKDTEINTPILSEKNCVYIFCQKIPNDKHRDR